MAPSATLEPATEFKSEFALPDLESLPERCGWPKANERGYQIKEQLCGTERKAQPCILIPISFLWNFKSICQIYYSMLNLVWIISAGRLNASSLIL